MSKKLSGSFYKAIKDNQKKIRVAVGDKVITLADQTADTIQNIKCCALDGLIPATVAETAASATDLPYLAVSTSFTKPVFSMYEASVKSDGKKQTLVIPLTMSAAKDIKEDEFFDDIMTSLMKNTNAPLVMEDMPKKVWKKVEAWAESDDATGPYVVRFPNLLLFREGINKKDVANPTIFDIILVFVPVTNKSLKKARKHDIEALMRFSTDMVDGMIKIIENYGCSSIHIPLVESLYNSAYSAASTWAAALKEKKPKLLKRCVFTTTDSDWLIAFNQEMGRLVNTDEGCGMRVV